MADDNTDRTGTDGAAAPEKTFTQAEVDAIVSARLARERGKGAGDDLAQREADLAARELRMTAREKISAEGLPAELVDMLRYTDAESLDNAIESYKKMQNTQKAGGAEVVGTGNIIGAVGGGKAANPMARAFGLE